jgi:hypothetical protein
VLPSLVIKIEYCRALHRGSKERVRPGSLSCLPSADKSPISLFRDAKSPSVSSFSTAFLPGFGKYVECDVTLSKQTTATYLPGATTAPHESGRGTPFYTEPRNAPAPGSRVVNRFRHGTASAVGSLVCPGEEKSFRADSPARAFACTLETPVCPGAPPTGVPGDFFAKNSVSPRPFLTGSAPQTELPVTHSKQTFGPFLTGSRTGIKEFANSHSCAPKNLLLHRGPIRIFLRPTI